MDRQLAGHQIGFGGQDVLIFPDPRDFARAFELAQCFAQGYALIALQAQFPADLDLVERPIIAPAKECKNLPPKFTSVRNHAGEMILLDFTVDVTRIC